MDERTCGVEGCVKPHRARGLCVTHYNQQMPNRHRKKTVECEHCGKPCVKYAQPVAYAARYCSMLCRDKARKAEAMRRHSVPALWVKPMREVRQPTVRADEPRLFVAGTCPQCGVGFVSRQPSARYCSPRCYKRWSKNARRERNGERIPRSVRAQVYARDSGICQLCDAPVDMTLGPRHPYGPTLDHIECVSWALVPDHRAANLRLAHRACNSARGNRAA